MEKVTLSLLYHKGSWWLKPPTSIMHQSIIRFRNRMGSGYRFLSNQLMDMHFLWTNEKPILKKHCQQSFIHMLQDLQNNCLLYGEIIQAIKSEITFLIIGHKPTYNLNFNFLLKT